MNTPRNYQHRWGKSQRGSIKGFHRNSLVEPDSELGGKRFREGLSVSKLLNSGNYFRIQVAWFFNGTTHMVNFNSFVSFSVG